MAHSAKYISFRSHGLDTAVTGGGCVIVVICVGLDQPQISSSGRDWSSCQI